MPEINFADINFDELFCLKEELSTFINAAYYIQRAKDEQWDDYEELQTEVAEKFNVFRSRVKNLSVVLGLDVEFLNSIADIEKRYELKILATGGNNVID